MHSFSIALPIASTTLVTVLAPGVVLNTLSKATFSEIVAATSGSKSCKYLLISANATPALPCLMRDLGVFALVQALFAHLFVLVLAIRIRVRCGL